MPSQPVVLERFFGPERPLKQLIGVNRARRADIKPAAALGGPQLMSGFDARNDFAGTASSVRDERDRRPYFDDET